MTTAAFIDTLAGAAREAEIAETAYRREASARIAALESERAFAYRRLNWMKSVVAAVAGAEDETDAIARSRAALQDRLGWESIDTGRSDVLDRVDAIAAAAFAGIATGSAGEGSDVGATLAAFEAWYLEDRGRPFWALFQQSVVELPLVEC
jgi:hypothetical protein